MADQTFDRMVREKHEHLSFFFDEETGLKCVIAIHNTTLGPALGGCRMRSYDSIQAAVEDALRLAEGMTYKSSLAGLDLGGGKAVIIQDPKEIKDRKRFFEAYARIIEKVGGKYITAEDMGTSDEDMKVINKITKHVVGLPEALGGVGNPAPYTARGTVCGILAASRFRFGSEDLSGKKVIIQGVGAVGSRVASQLKELGASLVISDVDQESIKRVVELTGAEVVSPEALYDVEGDIFCPCAMGQTVNPRTIERLKVKVIAGAANNQLSDPTVYSLLDEKRITYVPDFVINAGGIIAASIEQSERSKDWMVKKIDGIGDTVFRVLEESRKRNRFPELVAIELAKERIEAAKTH